MSVVRLRCAIYTRKSSEEGLEQNFNSLHAQREACEAYVLSQAGEGWNAIKAAYDDGGYSGGSMDRPGLQQLMADIQRGLVDVVVVYKVDRLTRSLADFAKIVELFDAKGVSFVSVTQAFNTTSSMGRLTLNVLLSFAQFEREVTGERIRDKVAASKAKGLRMGGQPPLGYDIVDGRLAVNKVEAARVQRIFQRYLELGTLLDLVREGVEAKRWVNKSGRMVGGGMMGRGALHYLLTNPAYRGITRQHEKRYEDTHPAIIDAGLWDAVQTRLAATNASQPKTEKRGEASKLEGLIFDDRDNLMVPVHTKRAARRYRYYVSRPVLTGQGRAGSLHRIPAGVLEQFLAERIGPMLAPAWRPAEDMLDRIVASLRSATLSEDQIAVRLVADALSPAATSASGVPIDDDGCATLRIAFFMRRRGAIVLQAPGAAAAPADRIDRALVRAIALARVWAVDLESGRVDSIKSLARREGLCNHYATRLLPLAYLAPDLIDEILDGRQPRNLTLSALTAEPLPLDWGRQRERFRELAAS